MELKEKLIQFFTSRKTSYQFTFNPENRYNNAVMKDLAKFCRANETTYQNDPRLHAVLEGRREVWLRIQNYLDLTPEELMKLYAKD